MKKQKNKRNKKKKTRNKAGSEWRKKDVPNNRRD